MSGGGARRRTIAALLAGTAAPCDPAAEEAAELERTAARIAWVRRACEAHREANDALTAAWNRLLEPYDDWDEDDLPEIDDPPEQELVDRLWKPLDDVRRRDLWPRHLYWSL